MNKGIIVLVVVICFLVGGALGAVVIKQSKQCLQQAQVQTQQKTNPFVSNVIVGVNISGKVTNIQNKIITVSIDKDSLSAEVLDSASIIFYGNAARDSKTGKTPQEGIKASFLDIKVGQTVYIKASPSSDGKFQASSVFITEK